MKKPILILFFTSFLIFNGISCNKEPSKSLVKFDPVFLSYFAFPKGSWWTYKEINTGKTDSFYVDGFKIENFTNSDEDNYYYERLRYHLTGEKYVASGDARPNPNIKLNTLLYQYIERYHAAQFGLDYDADRFIYPSNENETFNNSFYMLKNLDTITINSTLYKDVYVTNNSTQEYYNPIKSEYYCKNVGVIRRDFFDSTVWELTNYHINK